MTVNKKDIPGKVVTSGVQCHFRKKKKLLKSNKNSSDLSFLLLLKFFPSL